MPVLGYLLRRSGAIGLAFNEAHPEDSEGMAQVLNEAAQTLADGKLLALFPETTLTPDGEIQPFSPLLARILERHPVQAVHGAAGIVGQFLFPDRRRRHAASLSPGPVFPHRAGGGRAP